MPGPIANPAARFALLPVMRIIDLNPDGDVRTWLLEDAGTGKAVIVDPVQSRVRHYLEHVRQQGLELRAVVETHTHSDHLSGAPELARLAGVPLVMHHQAARACVDRRVHDGYSIELGETELIVLSTPGHTHDSISLLVPEALIAGDLFLPGPQGHGDESCADSRSHADTVRRLEELEATLPVYGTHDRPGARPEPLLIARAAAAQQSLPRPFPAPSRTGSDFHPPTSSATLAILRANATCARPGSVRMPASAAHGPEVERIAPSTLAHRLQSVNPPHVVDVRSVAEYDSDPLGRIPGSLLLPLEHLEAEAENLKELSGEVVLTCRTTLRAVLGAELLQRAGIQVGVLSGGIIAWRAEGLEVETGESAAHQPEN